ncbi:MAG: ATP-binding protein [Elusimicrobia bacterium]|nr:ATP-binding protein [Elusimicrobiota bacterium]
MRDGDGGPARKDFESLCYSISHDLKAPLRAIDGYSEILLREHAAALGEEGVRAARAIRRNAGKMAALLDALLSWSRAARQELKPRPVDMGRLAREVGAELRGELAGRRVRLEVRELPPARADALLMRQVWVHLLSNALKFTGPRGEAAVVEVAGRSEAGELVYSVRDNGVGFDMAYADRLFNVLQRLHSDREFAGAGAGLAVVRRIVERHGGRVWAEGRVGAGSTFFFALPKRP